MPSWPSAFQFGTFLSVALSKARCIFALVPSLSPSNTFSMLVIHSAFVMISSFSYFAPKLFYFLVIRLLISPCALFPNLLVEFSFVVLECPVMSVSCHDILLVFLLSPNLPIYFLEMHCLFYFCFTVTFLFCPNIFSVLSFLLVVVNFLSIFTI